VNCLERRKIVLGLDHVDVLSSMNTLVMFIISKASLIWRDIIYELLGEAKFVLGPGHVDTLTSMNSLANVYRDKRSMY